MTFRSDRQRKAAFAKMGKSRWVRGIDNTIFGKNHFKNTISLIDGFKEDVVDKYRDSMIIVENDYNKGEQKVIYQSPKSYNKETIKQSKEDAERFLKGYMQTH